jgi:FMN phosphatase YigB (HAD superfamily)
MKTLLFDFDGVLIKNPKLENIIENKSIEFVSKQLHNPPNPKELNKNFYRNFGHTAIGLKHFYERKQNINVKDFIYDYNEYVFSNINYNELKSLITNDDRVHMNRLFTITGHKKENVGIFTNAPSSWCENIAMLMDIDIYEHVNEDFMFTSNEGLVKPLQNAYNKVEQKMNTDILFIDDSIQNLLPILYSDRWNVYLQNNFYRQNLYSYLSSSSIEFL